REVEVDPAVVAVPRLPRGPLPDGRRIVAAAERDLALGLGELELAAELDREPELDPLVDEPVRLDRGDRADAPDVIPTTSGPSSHVSSISDSSSIRCAATPPARATSARRLEFDELRE